MTNQALKKILKVFLTLQWAKELPRQGFIALGFKRNEADSVAAHSWTTSVLVYFLASELKKNGVKIDINKAVKMALFQEKGKKNGWRGGHFCKRQGKGCICES